MTATMLTLTIFCSVSGGPYGLEPLISASGSGLSILLILAIPILWALPDSLMTAEMASALPVEGGYVFWVKRTMGPFWAFLNAWWTWIYSLVDAAIYPVLFATYLSTFLRNYMGVQGLEHDEMARWAISLVVIVVFTWLNVRGTRLVGLTSSAFAYALIAPFVLMIAVGGWRLASHPVPIVRSFMPPSATVQGALKDGLAIVMWNYLGWDVLSTIAEEVDQPERAYPRAILIGVPLVTALYLLSTIVGLAYMPEIAKWQDGSWPDIARATAGPWIGFLVNVAGLVSPVALFTASLLGSSRVPYVLAEDGFFPKALVAIHPRFGTPWRSILLCGVVYAVLAQKRFQDLVQINVMLYGAALVLECGALVILRRREPNLPRPFRVPGGMFGAALLVVLPLLMLALLAFAEGAEGIGWTVGSLLSGPILYVAILALRRRKAARA